MPLLECAGLNVAYGRTQILFDVSIDVDEGEVLAVLGMNGAGKSTLLRAISGLTPPKGGKVLLDGRNVTGTSPVKMASLGVAHMPGGRGIFPDLTVGENLRMATWSHRRNKARSKRALARALDLFPGLSSRLDTRAGLLSGGQQQMLALAQAFMPEPRLLLVDELSLGLAPISVVELLDVVRLPHGAGRDRRAQGAHGRGHAPGARRAVGLRGPRLRDDSPRRARPVVVVAGCQGNARPRPPLPGRPPVPRPHGHRDAGRELRTVGDLAGAAGRRPAPARLAAVRGGGVRAGGAHPGAAAARRVPGPVRLGGLHRLPAPGRVRLPAGPGTGGALARRAERRPGPGRSRGAGSGASGDSRRHRRRVGVGGARRAVAAGDLRPP